LADAKVIADRDAAAREVLDTPTAKDLEMQQSRSATAGVPTNLHPDSTDVFAAEEAAILKAFLQSDRVPLIIAGSKRANRSIAEKTNISPRTIGKRLKGLIEKRLVEEHAPKKGFVLTALGREKAIDLPALAGADLLKGSSSR
jgi:DNA-binding MarR family transcriptional regulator